MEGKDLKARIGIVNIEKRKYPRFSIELPIEYQRIDFPITQKGEMVNASEGGLLVYLPEKMQLGQALKLKLFFNQGIKLNTIDVMAEVVWIDMHFGKDWGDYRMGLKFIDISPEDQKRLRDFFLSLSN